MNIGDIIDELSWNILSQDGAAATTPMNGANLTVNGVNVWSGTYQAVLGMNTFNFTTPITYTGGDLVVEWCFDNSAYVSGNNLFESTTTAGTMTQYADLSTSSGCGLTALTSRTARPNAYLGFQAASGYTFAWSNNASTEDLTGVSAGLYCVTFTDCNGCTATVCDTVITALTPGCTDPLALNYNPTANIDDGSCITVVLGCTDPTALNYDSLANVDDGSCAYPCLTGIGANSESFETASTTNQGPWAEWTYDVATSTFPPATAFAGGWIRDNLGTGSTGTGPLNGEVSADGDYYLYCETSGGAIGAIANLNSSCIDLNNFASHIKKN